MALSERARRARRRLIRHAPAIFGRLGGRIDRDVVSFELEPWTSLSEPLAHAVFMHAARRISPDAQPPSPAAWKALLRGAVGAVDLDRQLRVVITDGRLRLTPRDESTEPRPIAAGSLVVGEARSFAGHRISVEERRPGARDSLTTGTDRQVVPVVCIVGELHVRGASRGETFRPFGMQRGRKPVREAMREAGIPASARAAWPIVADDLGVLWIPGVRADERCRVGDATLHPSLTLSWVRPT